MLNERQVRSASMVTDDGDGARLLGCIGTMYHGRPVGRTTYTSGDRRRMPSGQQGTGQAAGRVVHTDHNGGPNRS